MFEPLISLLISAGIHFTISDTGKISVSENDYATICSSSDFQKTDILLANDIIINDGIDPSSISTSNK